VVHVGEIGRDSVLVRCQRPCATSISERRHSSRVAVELTNDVLLLGDVDIDVVDCNVVSKDSIFDHGLKDRLAINHKTLFARLDTIMEFNLVRASVTPENPSYLNTRAQQSQSHSFCPQLLAPLSSSNISLLMADASMHYWPMHV
jgi:hypothetical protein